VSTVPGTLKDIADGLQCGGKGAEGYCEVIVIFKAWHDLVRLCLYDVLTGNKASVSWV
jgi:hypothetical protein